MRNLSNDKILSILLIWCLSFTIIYGQEDLTKDTLLVAYTQAPPFIIDNQGVLSGISIYLWEEIANGLDIPYRYQAMPFKEILEGLENGTIDISINPLTITHDRYKKFDFTHCFYTSNSTIAVHEITTIRRASEFLKSIFNLNFLRGLLFLFFLVSIFGLLIWYFEKEKNPEQFHPESKGIWDGIWWSIVTMTTVGYGDKTPKTKGGKIVALVWMLSGILFISGLTASIASSLTVNRLSVDAEQLDDFKRQAVGTVRNSGAADYLQSHFFRNVSFYDNVLPGLNALETHKIDAFLYDAPILKYRINETPQLSHLEVLPIYFNQQFYAFGLPRDRLELKEKISRLIIKELEHSEWQTVLEEFDLLD